MGIRVTSDALRIGVQHGYLVVVLAPLFFGSAQVPDHRAIARRRSVQLHGLARVEATRTPFPARWPPLNERSACRHMLGPV